jgi:hypothetical protein
MEGLMEAAQEIDILCDKVPARHNVVPAVTAAIGNRLGAWRITVRELYHGNCWDVKIHRPDGAVEHFVFVGDKRSPENVRSTIEREFAHHALERSI